jgi:hypothetical protein
MKLLYLEHGNVMGNGVNMQINGLLLNDVCFYYIRKGIGC